MAEQIVLSNEFLNAVFSKKGAELVSLVKDEKEKIWNGDESVWDSHAPVLFPICGGLKDNKYVYGGREYTVPKHGYVRFADFDVESRDDTCVVFLHRSSEETLKQYPFEYELRVIYKLEGTELKVEYNIKNLSEDEMYFSVGSHEGFYCPGGIENYSIVFEKEENLNSHIVSGNTLDYKTMPIGENVIALPLKYEYFDIDALVFTTLKSKKVFLHNRITEEKIEVKFDDCSCFLLWTVPGAEFICIEPWCGCPDFVDSDNDFTHKKGIICLAGKDELSKKHSIVF